MDFCIIQKCINSVFYFLLLLIIHTIIPVKMISAGTANIIASIILFCLTLLGMVIVTYIKVIYFGVKALFNMFKPSYN